jgi:hypothetical protein
MLDFIPCEGICVKPVLPLEGMLHARTKMSPGGLPCLSQMLFTDTLTARSVTHFRPPDMASKIQFAA